MVSCGRSMVWSRRVQNDPKMGHFGTSFGPYLASYKGFWAIPGVRKWSILGVWTPNSEGPEGPEGPEGLRSGGSRI